jgi:hypothetical protein
MVISIVRDAQFMMMHVRCGADYDNGLVAGEYYQGDQESVTCLRQRMGRKPMEEYTRLKDAVLAVEADLSKALEGNKAAGTRVRKQMQEIKSLAQAVRVKVLGLRGA